MYPVLLVLTNRNSNNNSNCLCFPAFSFAQRDDVNLSGKITDLMARGGDSRTNYKIIQGTWTFFYIEGLDVHDVTVAMTSQRMTAL